MAESGHLSAPMRLIMRLVLTILLVYLLSTFLERIFVLTGGLPAYIIIGSLLTLMNVIVRPILNIILLPFKLIFGLVGLIVANGLFLWLTETITEMMDPNMVVLQIDQGIGGLILLALILGLANWIMKEILR
jgi:uncharacterized membrane protein YvlD (DUF360 family)